MTEIRRQGNGKKMKMHTLKCGMGLNFIGIFSALNAYIIGEGWKWAVYPNPEVIKSEIKYKEGKNKVEKNPIMKFTKQKTYNGY